MPQIMPKTPAYQRIKDAILANIHAGVWQVGCTIPTEHALAQQFDVSRMTVNRALKELAEEKVLERRQGSGTFVAQTQYAHTFVEIRNIAEDIKAQGKAYRAKVISKNTLHFNELSKDLQAIFDKDAHHPTTVYEVKIVHYADDVPVQFEERWVDGDLVPDFIHQDFNTVNTSHYLINTIALESGQYFISAQKANPQSARALGVADDEPILMLERSTVSQGKIITYVKMSHAGTHHKFSGQL